MIADIQWFSASVILLCERQEAVGLSHFSDEVDHLDGALGTIRAFVACFGTGTLDGLFDVFCSNDAEHHRDAAGK